MKELDTIDTIITFILFLLLIIVALMLYTIKTDIVTLNNNNYELYSNLRDHFDYYIDSLERLDFYYNDEKISLKVPTGYYAHNDYYCVWTRNRTIQEINETDYHEVCHELISKDYEHFCKK